jgi:outer membrane receptor for ferrienterochelin and colicins
LLQLRSWRVAVIALALAVPARADEAASDPTPDGVETIEVRGAFAEDPLPALLDAPVETEVISASRIRSLPAKDLADVAANLPGIRVQRRVQGQNAAASVEGLPPEYTKALVNGQHYAGELGGVGDLEDFPISNASEVLVLRGPQAMRYGADAGGAVIDVRTFQPPFEDGWRARLDGGGGDQGQAYGSQVSAIRLGRFGATLATTYDGIDGQEDRGSDAVITGTGKDSREEWQDGYATLLWNANESFVLRSNLGWRKDSDSISGDDGLPDERRDTTRWIQSAGFSAALDDWTELEAELFHFSSDMDSTVGRDFELTDEEWKADVSLARRFELFGQEPQLRIGLDWRLPSLELRESEFATNTPGEDALDDAGDVDERVTATGLYAIVETPVTDWARLQVGAREQWQTRFDSAFVPQAALLLDPTSSLKLRLSWGQSYRTPSLRDLYQPAVPNLGGAYFLEGNPDLQSESAIGYRAGFEWTPHENVWIASTFFSNTIDDFIRSAYAGSVVTGTHEVLPDPLPGVCVPFPELEICQPQVVEDRASLFRKTNLDQVRTRGVEAQIRVRPSRFVDLRVGYTYLTTQVDSPLLDLDELPNEPRHTVDLESAFTLPRFETMLVTRARWRDSAWVESSGTGIVSFSDLTRSDPSWVIDLRLQQPIRPGLVLYADLKNLTNTDVVDSYEIRGRSFFVGLRLDLDSLTGSSP